MRPSIKKQIVIWLNQNTGFHKKVDMFVLGDTWGYSPETIGRALRQLAENKEINVDYYNGTYAKNLAKYASLSVKKSTPKVQLVERDGVMVAIIS